MTAADGCLLWSRVHDTDVGESTRHGWTAALPLAAADGLCLGRPPPSLVGPVPGSPAVIAHSFLGNYRPRSRIPGNQKIYRDPSPCGASLPDPRKGEPPLGQQDCQQEGGNREGSGGWEPPLGQQDGFDPGRAWCILSLSRGPFLSRRNGSISE